MLLLGWNELTPEARLRATRDLKAPQRDYPQLGFVISARRQALPITGSVVDIETLSQDQQMELARAVRCQDGADHVDRAWRTAGVRELVGTPLYLNALLTLPPGASFPETKEAVLRMFAVRLRAAGGLVMRRVRLRTVSGRWSDRTCSAMPAATCSPTRAMTSGRSKVGSAIGRSRAPQSIRLWRRTGSRISGGTDVPDAQTTHQNAAVVEPFARLLRLTIRTTGR